MWNQIITTITVFYRYYIVFAPALAYLATRLGPIRLSVAGAFLALWAVVAVTGARDMIGVNDTSGRIARELEASGGRVRYVGMNPLEIA